TPDASSRSSAELTAWARRRKELYGFAPDPGMPTYPFHPESRNTAIAVCRFDGEGLVEAGFEPCRIDDGGRPVPCGDTDEGRRVTDYIERITRTAGLNGRLVREDGRVRIDLHTERAS
ncbi:CapA family protein, partial [Streptomyces sp. SID5914]|nr:CapA family protein [Streptomyces sp. SID5914]